MDINARPWNMASEGNNIFPRSLSVNVKEASGIFLITLWWANKLAQMYTRSYTYITSSMKESHHFWAQNSPKKIFYGNTIFYGRTAPPLSGSKSWQRPKVNLGTVK